GPPVRKLGHDVMTGVAVTKKHTIGPVSGRRIVNVRLGDWPSGVYFVQLTAPGGRVGYAPFVLRPKHLGEHRVAVVMPTQTWQAYDHRNRGGNLIFLSANNFYWKIVIHGRVMYRVIKWRDLGRPEAALLGVEYFHNDSGEHRGNWVVRDASRFAWLLNGTGLGDGGS